MALSDVFPDGARGRGPERNHPHQVIHPVPKPATLRRRSSSRSASAGAGEAVPESRVTRRHVRSQAVSLSSILIMI